jgi:hypothetical protein
MTDDAYKLIHFMVKEMMTLKYYYKFVIEGCYERATRNYGFSEPKEGRDFVIKKVHKIIKENLS